ncbi:MAG: type I 3-dehydroquinate dehydratase [Nitrososphaeria archaeon]|nr:type I 3-dehydroquinate dehydratase [Nitrososphaeria archaeon]
MQKPKVCTVITKFDKRCIKVANRSDLIEVRIDMIGEAWTKCASMLEKPWIACNRRKEEGGFWNGDEESRIKELLKAITFGAAYIDIELKSPHIRKIVKNVKEDGKKVLISYHNFNGTPSLERLKKIFEQEVKQGADICKIVTTAKRFEDNLTILRLIRETSKTSSIVAFCMGDIGILSRILSPFFGGIFTYASIGQGLESARGQIDLEKLEEIYKMFHEILQY